MPRGNRRHSLAGIIVMRFIEQRRRRIPIAQRRFESRTVAGTIVVGEGSAFYYEHGRHMTAAQASELYDEKKRNAMVFARDLFTRFKRK